MVVMEDAVRLPRLPPIGLEVDARMVNDTVIIYVSQKHTDGYCSPV
jgi:hypothetical protein